MEPLKISYRFNYKNRSSQEFLVLLDSDQLSIIENNTETPDWARLQNCICTNCPAEMGDERWCPVAKNLAPLVQWCSEFDSHEEVTIEVVTAARTVSAHTSNQRGIGSLLGLIMATSDCPHTMYFRPMARFHLPFADDLETVYRSLSMYMLAQYMLYKKGNDLDLELNDLKAIYQNMHGVNNGMAKRLRKASQNDAVVNSLVHLDILAKSVMFGIDDIFEELAQVYACYLDK